MKHFLIWIILIFLVIVSGCRQPVGSIDEGGNGNGNGNGKGSEHDFVMLRPNRILYEVNAGAGDGIFNREADLRVFVADDSGFRAIDHNDKTALLLEVIFNPGMSSEVVSPIDTHFPFYEAGRYIIRGTYTYNGKTDEYSIEVRGDYINPGDGGDFFDFIWL